MTGRGERSGQIESARNLRRDRDDADVGAMSIDDGQDVRGREVGIAPRLRARRRWRARGRRRRRAKTRGRLSAAEFRIEKIALEVRGQNTRGAG